MQNVSQDVFAQSSSIITLRQSYAQNIGSFELGGPFIFKALQWLVWLNFQCINVVKLIGQFRYFKIQL